MTNKYWNHDNPFFPGSVVRADEANDKFDGIEVGFDRIEGITDTMANQIKVDVMADVQPKLDAHEAQVTQEFNNLKGTTQAELQAFDALLSALDADMRDRLSHVLIMPDGINNLVIPGYSNGNEIPYIDAQGNAAMLSVPDVTIPADWAKVYLGRQSQPPGTDLNGDPVREGAMFYNESLQRLEIYRNGKWGPGFINGSGVVFIGNIPPAGPYSGDLWFDTQTADLCLWYDDGTSSEWVVINSNYNALFGPGIGPILSDGTVPMNAPLRLSRDDPQHLDDAVSRRYLEWAIRNAAGTGGIVAPQITNGVDPRSNFPVDQPTATPTHAYDVRVAGTMLFFGTFGSLNTDYGSSIVGQPVQPGDFVISNGREWNLVRASGLAAGVTPTYTGPRVAISRNAPSSMQDGDMWLDTRNNEFKVAQSGTWLSVSGGGGGGGAGLPIAASQGDLIVAAGPGQTWQAEPGIDEGRY